jgi:hypothetical protein
MAESMECGTHSFRIGGATKLFQLGVTPEIFKHLGGWSSDAYKLYIQIQQQDLMGFARKMCAPNHAQGLPAFRWMRGRRDGRADRGLPAFWCVIRPGTVYRYSNTGLSRARAIAIAWAYPNKNLVVPSRYKADFEPAKI